ncbi:MAG: hypothetical protein WAV15_02840 [Minisyncoccia bacterium]
MEKHSSLREGGRQVLESVIEVSGSSCSSCHRSLEIGKMEWIPNVGVMCDGCVKHYWEWHKEWAEVQRQRMMEDEEWSAEEVEVASLEEMALVS